MTNTKILELIGFAAIGGTIFAFLGMGNSDLKWPVFWGSAGIALFVILYRKKIQKRSDK
ncbi:MAG: hypothetical protein R3327_00720 [Nitrosopumilaceae archaeon]|nr:hypothetical protein [Nitrosopumilaceae archaeon]